ncbi:MAG: hypothetical protein Q4B86_07825 [Eubacteriales bacterium]|nr:hypothetical protein [Eubacteriales bacterium]
MNTAKWNEFFTLVDDCYGCMMGDEDSDYGSWLKSFEMFKELVKEERKADPSFAPEFVMIDEAMDFDSDIEDWLTECLDEMDINEEYDTLLSMCDDMLELFIWPDDVGSDIRFLKARTMAALNKNVECVDFCKNWFNDEPQNVIAATAYIYALIGVEEYDKAKEIVDLFINEDTKCCLENDLIFIAAATLYQLTGDLEKAEQLKNEIEAFDLSINEDGVL